MVKKNNAANVGGLKAVGELDIWGGELSDEALDAGFWPVFGAGAPRDGDFSLSALSARRRSLAAFSSVLFRCSAPALPFPQI